VKEVKEFDDCFKVVFDDGEADVGDLVIGADGMRSICKEALFGKVYPPNYEYASFPFSFYPSGRLI